MAATLLQTIVSAWKGPTAIGTVTPGSVFYYFSLSLLACLPLQAALRMSGPETLPNSSCATEVGTKLAMLRLALL